VTVTPPSESARAEAARIPLEYGPSFSSHADIAEHRFREELDPLNEDAPSEVLRFIEEKELERKLQFALTNAGVRPHGTIVELGAGTCWLAAALVRDFPVERAVAIEFSERRLRELAPIAIAHIGADPSKIERRVADFFNHGLPNEIADFVFTDAAFHHAQDPARLAQVAYSLLRPGGSLVLFREPALSTLRRTREHGAEDEHGSFEHEYFPRQYLAMLREAGFTARKARASGGFATPRARALLAPPLRWLNGFLFSEFVYVGQRG
jgi:SAM-dependent methyltransferase